MKVKIFILDPDQNIEHSHKSVDLIQKAIELCIEDLENKGYSYFSVTQSGSSYATGAQYSTKSPVFSYMVTATKTKDKGLFNGCN